MLFNAGCTLTR